MAAMEGSDYFCGAFYRGAGNGPSTPEKAGCGAEHFAVEDLLDFSNEEETDESAGGGLISVGNDGSGRNSTDSSSGGDVTATGNSTDSSGAGDAAAVDSCSRSVFFFDQHLSGDLLSRSFPDAILSSADLCEPQIDEQAEWLSNFVEASFSSEDHFHEFHQSSGVTSTAFSKITAASSHAAARAEVNSQDTDGSTSLMAPQPPEAIVPGKVRSKRSRAHGSWSSKLIELPASMTATSSPESELIAPPALAASTTAVGGGKKTQKTKKKEPSAGGAALAPAPDGRKCFHCQTDKTPQWRTGPMGPKTLCNACGVRFKSGRLVPEYRPAASPTFVASEHSNSHRKVLELRRQKEMLQQHHLFHSGDGASAATAAAAAASLYDGPSPVPSATGEYLMSDHGYRHHLSY